MRFMEVAQRAILGFASQEERTELDGLLSSNPRYGDEYERLKLETPRMREALALMKQTEGGEIPDWGRARVQARVQQVLRRRSRERAKFWRAVIWATCAASVAVVLIASNFVSLTARTPGILAWPETPHLRSMPEINENQPYTANSRSLTVFSSDSGVSPQKTVGVLALPELRSSSGGVQYETAGPQVDSAFRPIPGSWSNPGSFSNVVSVGGLSLASPEKSVMPEFGITWFDTSWFDRPSKSQMDNEVHILHGFFPSLAIQSMYTRRSLERWLNRWPEDGVKIVCGHPRWVGTAADTITVKGRWRGNLFEKDFAVSNNDLDAALIAAKDYIEAQTRQGGGPSQPAPPRPP